jgi:hypothetical protein
MDNEYEVEAISGKKIQSGKPLYNIKWVGYDSSENTWEPIENLSGCKNLLRNFEKNNKEEEEKNEDNNKEESIDEPENFINNLDELDLNVENVKRIMKKNDILYALCEFAIDSTGEKISDAYIPTKMLKFMYPKPLIKFYESKIIFRNNN